MIGWATVGKQCVCVDDDFGAVLDFVPQIDRHPMRNEVLTIIEVVGDDGDLFLAFAEIPASFAVPGGLCDVWWPVDQFRPLVTHSVESDAAMFIGMLDSVEVPA